MLKLRILYLGLKVPSHLSNANVIHCPLIQIVPKERDLAEIITAFSWVNTCTHLLFTSQSAVAIFFDYCKSFGITVDQLQKKHFIAVGEQTARKIVHIIDTIVDTPIEETAEGVVTLLESLLTKESFLFWPHAARSRPIIEQWLQKQQLHYHAPVFYDTLCFKPNRLPKLDTIDEIIFTSPSIVDSFIKNYGALPRDKILTPIGSITRQRIDFYS